MRRARQAMGEEIGNAASTVGKHVIRDESDCLSEIRDRLVIVALFAIGIAAQRVGVRVIRVELQRVRKAFYRGAVVAPLVKENAFIKSRTCKDMFCVHLLPLSPYECKGAALTAPERKQARPYPVYTIFWHDTTT